MIKPGKIVKNIGCFIGEGVEAGINLATEGISTAIKSAGKEKAARNTKRAGKFIGKVVGAKTKIASTVAGKLVDKTIEVGTYAAKNLKDTAFKSDVKIYGDAEQFYDKSKIIETDFKIEE